MSNNHSKKYIGSGIIVSNLVMVFAGAFILPWIWRMEEFNGLLPMILIVLVTLCSSIASYFWSFTGIPLKKLRWLAVVNLLWVWIVLLFQPYLAPKTFRLVFDSGLIHQEFNYVNDLLYNFTSKLTLVIILFSSLLGNWFGRRFFYE